MTEHIVTEDGLVHDAQRLKELQALPWQRKVFEMANEAMGYDCFRYE